MKPITPGQIKAFNVLLNKAGLAADKKDIVIRLSDGRATSTKDLYSEEIQPWINAMNSKQPGEDEKDQMVRYIIAMAREMKTVFREAVVENGELKQKSNYEKLNLWMLQNSYLKKPLNWYKYHELPKLVSQFEEVYKSWIKR